MRAVDLSTILIERTRAELSAEFKPGQPLRVSVAPGVVDVMGGTAAFGGAMSLGATLEHAAAIATQPRGDGQVQVMSFNQLDQHKAFTLRIPTKAIAEADTHALGRDLHPPDRHWASGVIGALHLLHRDGWVDLQHIAGGGLNVAMLHTLPGDAPAAMEMASVINLIEHFAVRDRLDPLRVATICAQITREIVGRTVDVLDYLTSCVGESHQLTAVAARSDVSRPPVPIPPGVRVYVIHTGLMLNDRAARLTRLHAAAVIAHRHVLKKMREIGTAMNVTLVADPMGGLLGNLDPDNYKSMFRPSLPEQCAGREYLERFGADAHAPSIEPHDTYLVQHAADHVVLEARRVIRFSDSLRTASDLSAGPQRTLQLNRAGHLMYASHQSSTMDAMLGSAECDAVVAVVRRRESSGLYGARLTDSEVQSVVILGDDTDAAQAAVAQIAAVHGAATSSTPTVLAGGGRGAWHAGSAII